MRNHLQVIGLVLVAIGMLMSCSTEEAQIGVITATIPGTPLEPGSIVIVEPSNSRTHTHTVKISGDSSSYQVLPDLIRVYETRESADRFLQDAAGVLGVTATSRVHALRVRAEPGLDADVVYRLRSGEEVQLVMDTETTSTINGRTGVWYELIAGGQHRGFVFGPLLADTPAEREQRASGDYTEPSPLTRLTKAIGADVWVSSATAERFASGGLDVIAMRLRDQTVVFRINDEERRIELGSAGTDGDVVAFPDENMRMTLRAEDEVSVTFTSDEGPRFMVLHPQEKYNWVQLWSEYQRRRRIASLLTEHAGLYRSGTYGTVQVFEDGNIRWTNKHALIPRVFATDELQEFGIQYIPRMSRELKGVYDGAIMLGTPPSHSKPVFLVDLLPGALRMVWVPAFDADDPTIAPAPVTPLIMYFSAVDEVPMKQDAG